MANSKIEPHHIKLASERGISEGTLRERVNRHGWTPDKAAVTPLLQDRKQVRKRPGPPRSATPEEIADMEGRGVHYTVWPKEEIEAHLARIGPDKGFEMHQNRGKQTSVTGPQLTKGSSGRYYRKGGEG